MTRKYKSLRCRFKVPVLDLQEPSSCQSGSTGSGAYQSEYERAGYAFRMSEGTPLYRRQATNYYRLSKVSGVAVCMLLGMMVVGVTISSYMLHKQNQEDSALGPSADSVLQFVYRREWTDRPLPIDMYAGTNARAMHVVFVQTGTSTCDNFDTCATLLREMMADSPEPLPHNFFLTSNGMTFEWLGWRAPSPLYPQLSPMVVGFIGSFEEDFPSVYQIQEAFSLLDESVVKGFLIRNFSIVGKVTKPGETPTYLFDSVVNLTQWNAELSDDF